MLKEANFNSANSRLTESALNPKLRSTANITNLHSVSGFPVHSARVMSSSPGGGQLSFRSRGGGGLTGNRVKPSAGRVNVMSAHSNISEQFHTPEQEQVQQSMKELNHMAARAEQTAISQAKMLSNRYPKIELERSVNFERFYIDKVQKKQRLIMMAQAKVQANKH